MPKVKTLFNSAPSATVGGAEGSSPATPPASRLFSDAYSSEPLPASFTRWPRCWEDLGEEGARSSR